VLEIESRVNMSAAGSGRNSNTASEVAELSYASVKLPVMRACGFARHMLFIDTLHYAMLSMLLLVKSPREFHIALLVLS